MRRVLQAPARTQASFRPLGRVARMPLPERFSVRGRTALVTGALRGVMNIGSVVGCASRMSS